MSNGILLRKEYAGYNLANSMSILSAMPLT